MKTHMKTVLDVGDKTVLKSFSFSNRCGGTGMSNWKHDEQFKGIAHAVVEKSWHDYETGWRYIGRAASPDLEEYLDRNAQGSDRRLFFGQFDANEVLISIAPPEPRFMYEVNSGEPSISTVAGAVDPATCVAFDTLAGMVHANLEFPEFVAWLKQAKLGESITTGGGAAPHITTWRVA